MVYIYLIISILFLLFGHFFKVHRQKQFIEIYEQPDIKNLLKSLSFAYIINFFIPFKLGDLFRASYSGKKMKNGFSFSFSTVMIDRLLDIFVVSILFLVLFIFNSNNEIIGASLLFYGIISLILLGLTIILFKKNKIFKLIIYKTSSIFNNFIQLKLLIFSWCLITSFKNIFENVNKKKLLLNTIIMWTFYALSYYSVSIMFQQLGNDFSVVDVLVMLFSIIGFENSALLGSALLSESSIIFFCAYLILPLILMLIIAKFVKFKYIERPFIEVLPQINVDDKLGFLELYFSAKNSEYIKNYLLINQDVNIIKDYSAGSNATTLLCSDNKKMFFRKYSVGKDAEKLYSQALWLEKQYGKINVTKVANIKFNDSYCCYDMPYVNGAVSAFNHLHSVPINDSWFILKNVLTDLSKKVYVNTKKSKKETIIEYVNLKVIANLKKIEQGFYIKNLLKYETLNINGKNYKNLNQFKFLYDIEFWTDIFKHDRTCNIHGDLTLENIICHSGNKYYLIDSNSENLHNTDNLDYAKLLQSIHGNYEFYMNIKNVSISENNISYFFTKSVVYDKVYSEYKDFLNESFEEDKVKSIYYHEIIHWLRLLPYKIEKNKERSILFYSAMVIIINDIVEMYGEE